MKRKTRNVRSECFTHHISVRLGLILSCLAAMLAVSCAPTQTTAATPLVPASPAAGLTPAADLPLVMTPESLPTERLQPADLVYLGAFRLPDSPGTPDNVGWEWGGSALTYYPAGDPAGDADGYPGSLFGAGHDQTPDPSDVRIPGPLVSAAQGVVEVDTAVTLRPFRNVHGHWSERLDCEMPRVRLA